MEINISGLVILIIGALFLLLATFHPENFFVYKLLKGRAAVCVGDENARVLIAGYSVVMMIFGLLLMLRVFGKQVDDGEDPEVAVDDKKMDLRNLLFSGRIDG
mmetsp:Transcript_30945/g.65283  ORF Transcript_30945/g.65283 Transcript_30945/m.65283 type:complete len:103 (+) Transcript_30945:140-448(+)|eukprot:CAMPEP_0171359942 /NCGR_PEP_ID=MMETSP0879-20121228/896_1 /TAXON_ID=67004 /ORGANISM="Thalassiosira weissflogii, Strain CCMP1336" /LENGTH=102 /DNA_ID=CAMNT_0011866155 /DNA_START=122 /DNA_END=430 /DNA_ORIENTATION=-